MSITLTDIFAGAGGSSSGAAAVPGVEVRLAANHWRLAVDVHHDNHPDTDHACVDLHMEDPRNFPRTDVLWASPECTKWSIANSRARELSTAMGGDPTLFDDVPEDLVSSDEDEISRSRLLMFDVLRFIEHHHYRAVVVENVVDIATQAKYSAAWEAWRRGLQRLGYAFRVVSMNSMHAQAHGLPAPQSRDRLYVVAWPEGERAPDIDAIQRPKAHCPRCDRVVESRQAWKPGRTVGRYRAQYVFACSVCGTIVEPGWLPASTAIDWSLPAERIGDRARPLSPKTMARIREGLRRYGTSVIEAAGNTYDMASGKPGNYLRAWPLGEPLRTLHGTASKGLLLVPVEGRDGKQAAPATAPMRTQTCRNETALLVPYYSASETAKPTSLPVGTLTTVDRYALVMRNNSARGDGGYLTTPTTEPYRTLTTTGHQSILEPDPSAVLDVDDCRFRMLEPHEIAAGMSFPLTYRWQGTKRDRVRLAGNAVTPPAARDLMTAVAESLGVAA